LEIGDKTKFRNLRYGDKKTLKKVLTPRNEIQYEGGRFQNRQGLCPVGSLSVRIPLTHKTTKTRPGKRKNTHSMYSLNQVKTFASCGRDPARSLPLRRGFLLIPLILLCFAFAPQMRAITPAPDGCYPNFNTAEGCNALLLNSTGAGNTGLGWYSNALGSTGSFNTGAGGGTLALNNADSNSAVGAGALLLNTDGFENTAMGVDAMVFNDTGIYNDAFGGFALFNNIDGFSNNAFGDHSLFENINGAANTAIGDLALQNNDASGSGEASGNTAVGAQALFANGDGQFNDAVGYNALGNNDTGLFNQAMGADAASGNVDGASNVVIGDTAFADNASGSFNTVIGDGAGAGVEGSDNIYVGATAGPAAAGPSGGESGTIRIGDTDFIGACYIGGISGVSVTGDPVVVDSNGQLGVAPAGHPFSMNELLKERQIVQQLKTTTEKQAARIALQENQIQTLTAALKQQSEQIQKVSAQLEMIRPAPRVVGNR
jgi:hypothetical protein